MNKQKIYSEVSLGYIFFSVVWAFLSSFFLFFPCLFSLVLYMFACFILISRENKWQSWFDLQIKIYHIYSKFYPTSLDKCHHCTQDAKFLPIYASRQLTVSTECPCSRSLTAPLGEEASWEDAGGWSWEGFLTDGDTFSKAGEDEDERRGRHWRGRHCLLFLRNRYGGKRKKIFKF